MKYYRNAITVQWLSNEPWQDHEAENLDTVSYEITEGDSIGTVKRLVINELLTRDKAVELDAYYGGDGSFIIRGEEAERLAQAARYAQRIIEIKTPDDSFTDLIWEVSDGTLSGDNDMIALIWDELESRGEIP